MKKPNITEGEWEIDHTDLGEFLVKGRHDYVCEVFENLQEVENAQAMSAVPDMIDVLVAINDSKQVRQAMGAVLRANMISALKKAGVEL